MYGRWTVMSRIGNRVLNIPAGVEVTLDGNKIITKGPKGTLEYTFKNENVDVQVNDENRKYYFRWSYKFL